MGLKCGVIIVALLLQLLAVAGSAAPTKSDNVYETVSTLSGNQLDSTVAQESGDRTLEGYITCAVNASECLIEDNHGACRVCASSCGSSSARIFCNMPGNPVMMCIKGIGGSAEGSLSLACATRTEVIEKYPQSPKKEAFSEEKAVNFLNGSNWQRGGTEACPLFTRACPGQSCGPDGAFAKIKPENVC